MMTVNTIQSIARATAQSAVYEHDLLTSNGATTTDTTTTTIATITPQDDSAGVLWIMCAGYSGSEGVTGIKAVRFIKLGTAITLGTPAAILATEADTGLAGADFTIAVSGTDIVIQVTGIAATEINWTTKHQFINVVKEASL